VESLCKVADVLPEADFVDHFVPLIKRLATGDWFTARTSGCGLFAKAYSRLTGKLRMASQPRMKLSLSHNSCFAGIA
jgi:serine/threonine-protein phosphatase 2A regulatory subunit A